MEPLKNYRAKLGLSQKALGDLVGVSEATISNYETGKREPDLKTLCALADLFDCSLDMLVRGKEKDHSAEWSKQEMITRLQNYDLEELHEMALLASYLEFRRAKQQQQGQGSTDNQ